MIKIKRSVLIYCIHYYLSKLVAPNGEIDRRKLISELGMGLRIPKEHRDKVVKELEDLHILKKVNRDAFQIKSI